MSELVVLVPVLNRPWNVSKLVESFAQSGTPGLLVFLVNESDKAERRAISKAGAQRIVVDDQRVSWPAKINEGYRRTREPWMLCCGDDVRFRPGWWEATERLRDAGFSVIGTNDLGNPRVLQGEHTTHPLIRRSYVDEFGTMDGDGVVHEGYRHWCCDNEIVATAKARGAWAFCRESVVEHMHPYWRKGEWDAVYALGEQHANEDIALWEQRQQAL